MKERDLEAIDTRVKIGLLVVSSATIVCLAAAALRENVFADWHRLRSQYARLLKEKATDARGEAAARQFEVRIVQNYLPEFGTADRCITCHAGVEDPRMADEPQPFTTHPGRYLEFHDPAKFGCTVCHQGQGSATEIEDAHGRSEFWDYPLLAPELVRSTCTKCHPREALFGDEGLIAAADATTKGAFASARRLFESGRTAFVEGGCLGCHAIDGKGGTIGPDLTLVGEKTRHGFDFSHFGRDEPRSVTYWLRKHFLDPRVVSPTSIMPAVSSEQEADALTAYVLSLRRPLGQLFGRGRSTAPGSELSGRELYLEYCSACHGRNGRGGRVPGLRTPNLNNPDTLAAASDDYYRFIIESGRSGSRMPAWGEGHGGLSRGEIDRIVEYIRSWQPDGADVVEVRAAFGDARVGRSYFTGLCAGCHGRGAEGGIGNSLDSPTFLAIASDQFLAESIIYGRPGTAMPAWKHLPAQAVSDILAYLRSLRRPAPSLGEVVATGVGMGTRRNARVGSVLFHRHCASCHGDRGEGLIGPSITSPGFLGVVDDAYIYRAITEGRPGTAMPAWQHLPAADVSALIAFLRSFDSGPRLHLVRGPIERGDPLVGEIYYRTACQSCHGEAGSGGVGPQIANPVFLDSATDEMLFQWIGYGRPGTAMKGFLPAAQGPVALRRGQIADVIAYLREAGRKPHRPATRPGVGNPVLGKRLYEGTCASCHGPNGQGASGPQLNNPVFLRAASDGFLAATIVLGREGTPMKSMVRGQEGIGQIEPRHVQDLIAYMRSWQYPERWRTTRSIPEITMRAVEEGRKNYQAYCSGCHGPQGRGSRDGEGYFAPALNNPEFLAAASDGFLLATIARGREGTPMRPFGEGGGGIVSLSSRQISDIVSFIRSWQHPARSSSGGKKHEEI